jgi:hypothetical protein
MKGPNPYKASSCQEGKLSLLAGRVKFMEMNLRKKRKKKYFIISAPIAGTTVRNS